MWPDFKYDLESGCLYCNDMYNRDLSTGLLELSVKWPVISLTGPRQSGKTTLCKMTFPDYDYVNLEHLPTRDLIQSDMELFLDQHKNGLIIDEAQHLPELFSYIQVKVDQNKDLRYILTGSSDFLMMQNITQSLAGRVAVKRLLPLSISELGDTTDYSTDSLMLRGFYPAVWGDGREAKDVYESYYETYLERDVRQIINVQNLSAFRLFVRICASRIGGEFNASAISNECGVSSQTINNWMGILETSYTAFRLQPFYRNIGKRLAKTPKLYFYDVGLVCWLLGIRNEQDLSTHPLRGNVFENMVVVEFLKNRFNDGEMPNIYFYRDKSQHEVDVVQEEGLKIRCFEIKSGKSFHSEWFDNMKYLQSLMSESVVGTAVIYDGIQEQKSQFNGLINFRQIAD